jgi:hypothetical protein
LQKFGKLSDECPASLAKKESWEKWVWKKFSFYRRLTRKIQLCKIERFGKRKRIPSGHFPNKIAAISVDV